MTLTNSCHSKNQRIKRAENVTKIIYSETRAKMKFIDIKLVIFR